MLKIYWKQDDHINSATVDDLDTLTDLYEILITSVCDIPDIEIEYGRNKYTADQFFTIEWKRYTYE